MTASVSYLPVTNPRQRKRERLVEDVESLQPLVTLANISAWLMAGKVPVFQAPPVLGEPIHSQTTLEWEPIDALAMKRLDLLASIQGKLLDKLMPSQKALDVQSETVVHTKSFSDLALAARVAALLEQQPAAAALPAPDVPVWL